MVPAKLTIVVVIISFSVGKIQPFSTFPVYSHIPPVSEYYYMTDEKDLIIPIALKFDYDGGSLHKMIEYRYVQYSKTYGDPEILNKVGLETLDYLFETFAITSETVSYKQIKIWNAKVKMMNDQIVVVHKEIAKMQVL
ncbi:MAG: hypothetical protein COB85_01440 [Bacteroidetes bacterium]|nr:MAG: hypothetical protein COB85_01440 [Bacteroidota bacterium]